MRDLLPPAVAVAVADAGDWSGELLPAERACLSDRAVAGRRRDFTAGRVCARRALAGLGLPTTAVTSAPDRSPVWPAGVVGTITHTRNYCAAAAARAAELRSVGMDAERRRDLTAGVRRKVCLPEEEAELARLPAGVPWPTVLFSIKETVYKVWYPVARTWLDFADARVTLDPGGGHVHRPDRSGPGRRGADDRTADVDRRTVRRRRRSGPQRRRSGTRVRPTRWPCW